MIGALWTVGEGAAAVNRARQSHDVQTELFCAKSFYERIERKPNPLIDEMNRLTGVKPGTLEAMFGSWAAPTGHELLR